MIIDILPETIQHMPVEAVYAWYYEGCTCPIGHPPCSWCTSLTEEEVEILDSDGYPAVMAFRNSRIKHWKLENEKNLL